MIFSTVPHQGRSLVTGRMLPSGAGPPEPSAVLLDGGRVVAVGPSACSGAGRARRVRLAPDEVGLAGFADPHLHLLSTAAARLSVDCSPDAAPALPRVLARVASAAAALPPGVWVRGSGFDDALVGEHRYPTAAELDRAAPHHPVVLHHATGHSAVLNSLALRELGVREHTDGLLVRRHDLLAAVPRLEDAHLRGAVGVVAREMWDAGIVAFTDASHTNDAEAVAHIERMAGLIPQRVTAMIGWDRLDGLRFGSRIGRVGIGHAKVLKVGEGGHSVREAVETAHLAGFPVAIHAADVEELAHAIAALEAAPAAPASPAAPVASSPGPAAGAAPVPGGVRDRIEHCALALPEQIEQLARLGVEVTTQPSFLHHRGPKYLRELTTLEQSWLWRLRTLVTAGIPVRLSSDSPVVPARPLEWLQAAVARPIGVPDENVGWDVALGLAAAGPITPGGPFVVVGREPRPSIRHQTAAADHRH